MTNTIAIAYCEKQPFCTACIICKECYKLLDGDTLYNAIVEHENYDAAMQLKSILEEKLNG